MIDTSHAAKLVATPALDFLVAHCAERGIGQAEIHRALMLPEPDSDVLAALILRWCLT